MPLGTGNVTFLQVSPYVQKENADIHQNPPRIDCKKQFMQGLFL